MPVTEQVQSIVSESDENEVIDLFTQQIESEGGTVRTKNYTEKEPSLWQPKVNEVGPGDDKREMVCLSGYSAIGGRLGANKLRNIFTEQDPDNFRVVEGDNGQKKLIIKY